MKRNKNRIYDSNYLKEGETMENKLKQTAVEMKNYYSKNNNYCNNG